MEKREYISVFITVVVMLCCAVLVLAGVLLLLVVRNYFYCLSLLLLLMIVICGWWLLSPSSVLIGSPSVPQLHTFPLLYLFPFQSSSHHPPTLLPSSAVHAFHPYPHPHPHCRSPDSWDMHKKTLVSMTFFRLNFFAFSLFAQGNFARSVVLFPLLCGGENTEQESRFWFLLLFFRFPPFCHDIHLRLTVGRKSAAADSPFLSRMEDLANERNSG